MKRKSALNTMWNGFLKNGRIELSNNAADRMFRHIAIGRRNWLHSDSHDAAQNIAFIYSLYESCKLNDLSFFDCINDVLTRLIKGETDSTLSSHAIINLFPRAKKNKKRPSDSPYRAIL